MPLLLQTRHSVALNKFPLCHPTAARREEAAEGQLFPASLQECVCVRHTRDCSLPPPPTHWAAVVSRGVQLWKWPPRTPSPGCTEHTGTCRAGLKLRRAIKPLPAGHKAPACLRPRPSSLESCTLTSRWDFHHGETSERPYASSIFKTQAQALCLFWPCSPMLSTICWCLKGLLAEHRSQ